MTRPIALKPVEAMEMRLMRESGVSVKDCASYFDVSEATAMRALADLRVKFGRENFKTGADARQAKQRARSHLYNSQNATRGNE